MTTIAAVHSLPLPPLRGVDELIDIATLSTYVPVTRRRLRAGEHLYRAGQRFNALYLVHAGFLRASVSSSDGRQQVTGFPMRGDLLGVEAIGSDTHTVDIVALDACEVLELPYPAVMAACAAMASLQALVTRSLALELRRDHYWMLTLGTLTAEQRVAAFLLDLSRRHRALGFSACHFLLRMSRVDIASFLGIKHETVTRALSQLAARGVIAVERREIRVLSPDDLQQCAEGDEPARCAA
ncbi:MAG TPA: Crp/Fnr family transcriptional regulator [Tahibacter sp.]|uniref:Crp/Fnr family transcriptional regulator n=1 Tax=Tahibacter sp. TaxID=2056211 RepID=UPI002BB66DA6|nr:Crp/Fnr family transcriptional regulator [Tahibacter sp.]HSX60036.1 Crp/Fnr family transcriptional regulator [Tahibacter sp.]